MVRLTGFEPMAHSLEGCCSIQLSYRRDRKWSGREDLNLRLSAPKADALPGCATPREDRPKKPLIPHRHIILSKAFIVKRYMQ